MDSSTLIGFMGIALLIIINIAAVAFSYGSISQIVKDTCARLDKLENRLEKVEGRLEAVEKGVNGKGQKSSGESR